MVEGLTISEPPRSSSGRTASALSPESASFVNPCRKGATPALGVAAPGDGSAVQECQPHEDRNETAGDPAEDSEPLVPGGT
jgi:hypothetical protein